MIKRRYPMKTAPSKFEVESLMFEEKSQLTAGS